MRGEVPDGTRVAKACGMCSSSPARPDAPWTFPGNATEENLKAKMPDDNNASLRQATVLVVDDIPANQKLLRETLEPEGYEVLLATDGPTALEVAQGARPDVILLDVLMPGLNGFE